jgi:hypothetical protein
MRTSVTLGGKETPVEIVMWSKKKRDEIERKHGVPGSTYVNMVIGSLSQGKGGPGVKIAEELISKEQRRQDEVGGEFNIDMVLETAFKVDGETLRKFTREEVENLPDDQFEMLRHEVTEFLLGTMNKFDLLRAGLADRIRDDGLRKEILKFVDEVQRGDAEVKN